jgi:hypothetical protein
MKRLLIGAMVCAAASAAHAYRPAPPAQEVVDGVHYCLQYGDPTSLRNCIDAWINNTKRKADGDDRSWPDWVYTVSISACLSGREIWSCIDMIDSGYGVRPGPMRRP